MRSLGGAVLLTSVISSLVVAPARAEPVLADRVAVRYTTPETGGPARPRFITERELALFARLEAAMEEVTLGAAEYPERYVRAATDRLVARAMLASLMIQRGTEPPELPKLAEEARVELADRVGGAKVLAALLAREGLSDAELTSFLYEQVRAAWYLNRAVSPILSVTEDELRETFRATPHPFRSAKFDEVRARLMRWLVVERQRTAELEYYQSARARIAIASTER